MLSCPLIAPQCASSPEQGGREDPGRTTRGRSVQRVVESGRRGQGSARATGSWGTGQVLGLGARLCSGCGGGQGSAWAAEAGPEAGAGGAVSGGGSRALWEAGKRVLDRTCFRVGEGAAVPGCGGRNEVGMGGGEERGWGGEDVTVLLGVRNQGGDPACPREGGLGTRPHSGGVGGSEREGACAGPRGHAAALRGEEGALGFGAGAGGGTREQGSATHTVGDGN